MNVGLKNVHLDSGCCQQIKAMAVAGKVHHGLIWVAGPGRGCGLIVAAVLVEDWHGRVHGQGGVKHAVIAIGLVNTTAVD